MSAVGRPGRLSPALIGSITVLLIVITTFLAYNANKGLPWVPSRSLTVEVPNAADIVNGTEVRIGGTRVGLVVSEQAKQYPSGLTSAILHLKLDKGTQPLPVDTTVEIRARSLLGLKYVQLTPGTSKQTVPDGGSLPLRAATPTPVELDQLLDTFDPKTRVAFGVTITEFGNLLAGRGGQIGQLIDDLGPLSRNLIPVSKVLASKETGLVPFLRSLDAFLGALAAAGPSTPDLFRDLSATSGALARSGPNLGAAIDDSAKAFPAITASLAATRTLIGPQTQLASDLQRPIHAIAGSASTLAKTSSVGLVAFAGTPQFSAELATTLNALNATGSNDTVTTGLNSLTRVALDLQPLASSLYGAQFVCHYPTLLLRNLGSALSDGTATGNWLRAVPVFGSYNTNAEAGYATSPANGGTLPAGARTNGTAVGPQQAQANANDAGYSFLHSNPTPQVGANGVCDPGYTKRGVWPTAAASPQQITIGNGGGQASGSQIYKPTPPTNAVFATSGSSK